MFNLVPTHNTRNNLLIYIPRMSTSQYGNYSLRSDCASLWNKFIYLFIYFQFIYRWQILFHLTIRLPFYKQQGLSQTSGAINNVAECCYRWHQISETEPQFVVLIKFNINKNRNGKIRQYAPNWQMTLYQKWSHKDT